MEVKAGYKHSGGGPIPEDWEFKSIGEEIDLLTGFPFPSSGYSSTGIRLLRGSNIKRGETDWNEEITQYWPAITQGLSGYELREGDLVIAMDGSLVGKSFARLSKSDLPALLLQRVARIRSKKLEVGYLKEFIGSDRFIKYADSVKTVTAIPHISPKDIRDFRIPIPPTIEEQRAIAAALSHVDALINSLDRLIAKKRDLKQAAMQELLTPPSAREQADRSSGQAGKRRLPGFSGEWEVRKLSDLFTFSGGFSASRDQLSSEGYCYLHYGDIHKSSRTFIDVRSDYQGIPKLNIPLKRVSTGSLLEDGDVVFVDASEDDEGTSRHVIVVNKDKAPFISGLHTIVAKCKTNELDHQYRRYCFQTASIKRQFYYYAVGTKVSGISKTNIAKLTIPVPSLPEQATIATVLSDVDAEIVALEQKRDKTIALKHGMMQELLTGRIRLV
jgi:type I restriction enzyme S subunit